MLQVVHELGELPVAVVAAQDRRRVDGRDRLLGERRVDKLASLP
jgi:hypothetical protein